MSPEGRQAGQIVRERRPTIAALVTDRYFSARPELKASWKGARQKCTEDNGYHLDYLCEALAFGKPALFTEYIAWAAGLLASLKIPGEALALNLQLLREVLDAELEGANRDVARRYIDLAIAKIGGLHQIPSHLEGSDACSTLAREYLAALLRREPDVARQLILNAANQGTPVKELYLRVFQPVQCELGRLWQSSQIVYAQEHYCTACTQSIMTQLYPRIFSSEKNGRRMVAACVGNNLHEIGARMVADFFEMDGWETVFLGARTPMSVTLREVAARAPHVLAISATLSIHVQEVADLIVAARAAGSAPRILVGGPPFNAVSGLWMDVGADGCASDAAEALSVANSWSAA